MKVRMTYVAIMATVAMIATATGAAAHPDAVTDGALHDNKNVLHEQQHDGDEEGHIEQDVNYGFTLVGQDTLGGVSDERYTDVWSDGRGYAYVGTFDEPSCDRSGVYISDFRDPANPETINMIKSPPNTRVNDVKTIQVGDQTILIHSLEECGITTPGGQKGQGGIALYDVTDPTKPHALKKNFLTNGIHNIYPWTDASTGKTYLILTDDVALRDVLFVDITKPQSPKLIAEVGLPDWPGAQDEQSDGMGSFAASFNHDVWIANVGTEDDPSYEAVVSYWDAGFVRLDVNDPANPEFIDDSTYPDPDPITGFTPPEGNGHAAAYNADASLIFAGDEDFSATRLTFTIDEGDNAGEYDASEGAFTKPISELDDEALDGDTTYVGLACGSGVPTAPDSDEPQIAVAQRGVCTFQLKADTIEAAGYDGFVVFNDEARGDDLVTMGGDSSELAGIFVGHSTGLAIFDADSANDLTIGQSGEPITATGEFDGFGYFHLLDRVTLAELGYYAPGQVNDPDYASGFGDLTMHNVEGDLTDPNLAFISWYSLGMRAIETNTGNSVRPPGDDWDAATPPVDDYYGENVTEVGRYIAEDGSNFWGVHVTELDGERYILASDRNTGLHIFTFEAP